MTCRAKIASVPTSLATAVRIAVSSHRSIAARAGQPAATGGAVRSATASIASVAEPPLPSARTLPPTSSAPRGGGRVRDGVAAAEGHRDVVGSREERDPRGVDAERGQRALADDHRVHELDGDVADVGARGVAGAEGDEAPAAGEALGHAV